MTDLLHFEDFRAGQIFALGTHTLTPEEMIDYARDFDPQPQHLDPEAAKDLLGGLAASGWDLFAVAIRMMVDGVFNRSTKLGAAGVDGVQWPRPVRAGDGLRVAG